ncbi:MAG: hypothetical protein JO099_23525 [Acidobacteriia bacterium]|nr:hypothetical protein [Terriglobia bacterium]
MNAGAGATHRGEATGGRSLSEIYGKMASQPFAEELGQLWEQLGVVEHGPAIVLDTKGTMGEYT